MGESAVAAAAAASVIATESEENGEASTTFVSELNLILMVSFLSLSGDLETKMVEDDDVVRDDHRPADHAVVSDVQMKRQFKALPSRPIKFQTKIKDCRHCRRM